MSYKKISGVYKITNIITNKVYVGSSVNLNSRKATHFRTLRKGVHKNTKLQNSYNKYGENAFVYEVLEYVNDNNCLLEREQFYINKYNSAIEGYNILEKAGNSLGYKHSSEVRDLISKRQIGEGNYFWGKHLSDEHKARISAGNKGKKHSIDAISRTQQAHFKPILNIETQKIYESISKASEELGVSCTAISNVLRGKAKTCKGYHWEYIKEK